MSENLQYESLHNHTVTSDGELSYLELLETAARTGYGVIAFTDHDSIPSEERLKELKAYKGPVKWFLGCELSSGLPKELGGGAANMFHILGLFTDPLNVALVEHCRRMVEAREERMRRMVGNLKSLGFRISTEDCLEESGGETVGRPHIAKALARYPDNQALQEKLLADMEQAVKTDERVAKVYADMIAREPSQYLYFIFLDKNAYLQDVYVDYLYWEDMDDTVKLIRDAGGIAIVAHWPTIKSKIDEALLRKLLVEKRLDGIEVMSGFEASEEDLMERIASETGTIRSIGIDTHRASDLERFAANPGRVNKTIDTTKVIIDRVDPSLEWSNWNR